MSTIISHFWGIGKLFPPIHPRARLRSYPTILIIKPTLVRELIIRLHHHRLPAFKGFIRLIPHTHRIFEVKTHLSPLPYDPIANPINTSPATMGVTEVKVADVRVEAD